MHNITLSSFILLAVGLISIVFTIWNHSTLRRHLTRFRNGSNNPMADEKYFELKSRQEYIIAVSAIIVSLATFFGYQGLQSIKDELNKELQNEKVKLAGIKNEAQSALTEYKNLRKLTHDYTDTVKLEFDTLRQLNAQVKAISSKNIIQQNIYLVEGVKLEDYRDKNGFYTIPFTKLETIAQRPLPRFSSPPVVFFSASDATPVIRDVTTTSLRLRIPVLLYSENEPPIRPGGVIINLMLMTRQ